MLFSFVTGFVIIDRFYIALFLAPEQACCARVCSVVVVVVTNKRRMTVTNLTHEAAECGVVVRTGEEEVA